MRAELLVQPLVQPLRGEVDVELAERGQEPVRVVELEYGAADVGDLEAVAQRQRRLDRALEDARRMKPAELDRRATLRQDDHSLRFGPVRPDDDSLTVGVRSENVVRVRMVPVDDELDFVRDRHVSACSSRRTIPPTGTDTQSGRFASS